MRARACLGLTLVAVLPLGACATGASCTPVSIVVTAKEERTRIRMEPGGLRTTETGHLREAYREVLVREYWLKDAQGHWAPVSEAAWRAAEVGRPVEVCR